MLILITQRILILNKHDDTQSWFDKLKQKICATPTNHNELLALLRVMQERGILTPETLVILEGAFVFSEMRARDVMFPKNQLTYINKQDSYNKIIELVIESGHSRFPVTDNNLEGIIGILHVKDLLNTPSTNPEQFNIMELCRQATFIPESKRLDSLLRDFRQNKNHMAIVVDEYGAISGFITIEDIIEQIVGDIEDEFDVEGLHAYR
jgi:magnesium and cobalt transporter